MQSRKRTPTLTHVFGALFVAVGLLLALSPLAAFAQEPDAQPGLRPRIYIPFSANNADPRLAAAREQGQVGGVVTTRAGERLAGIQVTLRGSQFREQVLTTDASGAFSFAPAPEGHYLLTVKSPTGAFSPVTRSFDLRRGERWQQAVVLSTLGGKQVTSIRPAPNTDLVAAAATDADLYVSQSPSAWTIVVGDPFTVSLYFGNNGPALAQNVLVTVTLPTNITFVAADSGCTYTAATNNVVCAVSSLDVYSSRSPWLQLIPATTGNASITADVTSAATDPQLYNNSSSLSFYVYGAADADVGVNQSASSYTAAVGEVISYTLSVYNSGPKVAAGVVLTQTLPPGLTLLGAPAGCLVTGQQIRCDLGTLAVSSSAVLTVAAKPTMTGWFDIRADVSASSPDPYLWNNQASSSTTVYEPGSADLNINFASIMPGNTIVVGDAFTYSVAAANQGPSDAAVVTTTIIVTGPFSALVVDSGCTLEGRRVTCVVNALGRNVSILYKITGTAAATGPFTIDASVTSGSSDPQPWNNSMFATGNIFAVGATDMGVNIWGSCCGQPLAGVPYTYTVSVNNWGPAPASNVVVTDVLPAGLDFQSVSSSFCSYTAPQRQVTCNLGDLPVSMGYSFDLVVLPTVAGTFANQAGVTIAGSDPLPGNNTSSYTTNFMIAGTADLWVRKTISGGIPKLDRPLTYTLEVGNMGPWQAQGVVLTDTLPSNATFISASLGCTYVSATRQVTCAPGTVDITWWQTTRAYSVTVQPNAAGTLANSVEVGSPNYDPDLTNNTSRVETIVPTAPTSGISGAVHNQAGAALAAIQVQVFQQIADGYFAELRSVYTDIYGEYYTGPLETGIYRLRYSDPTGTYAPQYYRHGASLALADDIPVTGDLVSHIDAVLVPGGGIVGTVRMYDGQFPSYYRAIVYQYDGANWQYLFDRSFYTGMPGVTNTGTYTISGLATGTYRLSMSGDYQGGSYNEFYLNATDILSATDIAVTAGITIPNINFVLGDEKSRISGQVKAPDGSPLANVQVTAYISYTWMGGGGWGPVRTISTDAAGNYTIASLDPGTYTLRFSDPNWVYAPEYYGDASSLSDAARFDLPQDTAISHIDAVLVPGGGIVGTVRMYDGQFPSYYRAIVYQYDGANWQYLFDRSFYTGMPGVTNTGTYTISGLATGTYRLSMSGDYQGGSYNEFYLNATDILSATDIAVTAGITIPNINFVLGDQIYTGRISGQVSGAVGTLSGIRVDLYRDSGGWNGWWRLVYATTGADGRYTIGGLRDGSYRVRFVDPMGLLASLYYNGRADFASANTIVISGQNQVTGIDGQLTGAGAIAGQVSLSGGGFAGGIEVIAYRSTGAGWEVLGRTSTEPTGNYRIGGLPPGSYRIYFADRSSAHRPEYYDNAAAIAGGVDIAVTADTTTPDVNALLEPPAPPAIAVSSNGASVNSDPATGEVTVMMVNSRRSDTTITRAVACAGGVPSNVRLLLNSTSYPMSEVSPGQFQATIPANALASGDLNVAWECAAVPQQVTVGHIMLYDPSGKISNQVTGQPVANATVTLYRVPNWLPDTAAEQRNCRTVDTRGSADWNSLPPADPAAGALMNPAIDAASMSPTVNPQATDSQGNYGWNVAQGCYYVVVTAPGYRTKVSPIVGVPPAVTDLNLALMPDAAPTAAADTATTPEDSAVGIAVLGNDTDLNGDPLAIVAVGATPNGTATSNGVALIFTPTLNFNGTAVFTYTVSDGNFNSDAAVTVTVTPVNDPPTAADDNVAAVAGHAQVINVYANDSDVDGDSLTVHVDSAPAHGTAAAGADNTITYTPAASYSGSDQFTYSVTDPGGLSATAVVRLSVTNQAPAAVDDTISTPEDTPVTIAVLANDTDDNGEPLAITTAASDGHGTVTVDGTTLVFTPALNFNGTASLTYTASDGHSSDDAAVTVTVTPVNDAPIAADDSVTAKAGVTVTIAILANDSEVDGDTLTVQIEEKPDHGTAAVTAGGAIMYMAEDTYEGTDRLTYTITDAGGLTAKAAVVISVEPAIPGENYKAYLYLPALRRAQ